MADDEKESDNNTSRTTEWEFVSLTASAYAAAPGPKRFVPPDEDTKDFNTSNEEEEEEQVFDPMFMSKHFIFPPYVQANLLIEPNCSEIHNKAVYRVINPDAEEFNGPNKFKEDDGKVKSDDGLHGLQLFDKGKSLSDHSLEFGEGNPLENLAMVGEEEVMYGGPGLSVFDAELHQSVLGGERTDTPEANNSSHGTPVQPSDQTSASKPKEAEQYDGCHVASEAWWKRQAVSLYKHAKEGNTFWSLFVAAAVMGIAMLGQHWQKKFQLQQLSWHFEISDESFNRMLVPFRRFKDILVGGHQQNLLIRRGPASNQ